MRTSEAKILDLEQIKAQKMNKCIFCNSLENLQFFRKRIVCLECLKSMRSLYADGYFRGMTKHIRG